MSNELAELLREASELHRAMANDCYRRGHNDLAKRHFARSFQCLKEAASLEAQEPAAYRYEFADPISGGRVWRHSAAPWNGQTPRSSEPLYRHPPTSAVPEGMVRVEVSTSKFTSSELITNTEINESALRLPGMAADRAWGEISRAMAEPQQGGGEDV